MDWIAIARITPSDAQIENHCLIEAGAKHRPLLSFQQNETETCNIHPPSLITEREVSTARDRTCPSNPGATALSTEIGLTDLVASS